MTIPTGLSASPPGWQTGILAFGFLLAFYRLKQREIAQKTQLENNLNEEYRRIWREVNSELLLNLEYHAKEDDEGQPTDEGSSTDRLSGNEKDAIYSYVDLTNQQIYLRKRGRISKSRWKDWEAGIETMIQHPPIQVAWEEIKEKTDTEVGRDFDELRSLESPPYDFDTDPYYWDTNCVQSLYRWSLEKAPLL